ncbi:MULTISPECIES: ZIP family metal transporter [Achromobacter]|jgi:ZIP family zinc transporter|uniref:ZIP family metal transporter n=1 Tax=Alcaligenes xylosoxydans xylosoxydans TaxID=85698 RepID=A0A9W5AAI8_ALCXX|nr:MULTISPECIES: ZIP family metal transporter [Achromobacter]KAA5922927.1 ZIP family metal transporter [Achromobacter xylosoxidans]KMJ90756.1 divalent cation transporter [Achromobacter xylosoxidans]KWU17634.1 divalent cation transporter [Achromobacter xylosoxidans]MBK1982337.1 ZIP family metal transporter [Achromobacter xylosoxidans]MCH4572009.1 ZIP family metal transporter [Achromobacter xylosoxidans]
MNTFSRHRIRPAATSVSVWTLAVLVACLGLHQMWVYFNDHAPHVADALLGGMVAAGATAAGTLPILFARTIPQKMQDSMFGFGAGVMLAASAFSLVAPGIAAAEAQGAGPWGAGLTVGAAILLGAAALLLMDRLLPHEHFIKGREGIEAHRLRRTWLFVFAITLHNLPEGLAIGVGYAGNDPVRGTALATGIAIQDIPEGLVVAVALIAAGYKRAFAVALGMLSGLVEPVGAVLGAAVVGWSAALLPWGLGFAAGAMLFVISHEIIPESHRKGHEVYATCGLMLGFVLMMLLDTALG